MSAAVSNGVVSTVARGWSGSVSCGSSASGGASVLPVAAGVGAGVGVALGVIGSSGALMSPEIGGSAASNSASGTIGPSGAGVAVALGLGASGPLAGAEPVCAIWPSAGDAATSATAIQ